MSMEKRILRYHLYVVHLVKLLSQRHLNLPYQHNYHPKMFRSLAINQEKFHLFHQELCIRHLLQVQCKKIGNRRNNKEGFYFVNIPSNPLGMILSRWSIESYGYKLSHLYSESNNSYSYLAVSQLYLKKVLNMQKKSKPAPSCHHYHLSKYQQGHVPYLNIKHLSPALLH